MVENIMKNLAGNIPHAGPMRWIHAAFAQQDNSLFALSKPNAIVNSAGTVLGKVRRNAAGLANLPPSATREALKYAVVFQ